MPTAPYEAWTPGIGNAGPTARMRRAGDSQNGNDEPVAADAIGANEDLCFFEAGRYLTMAKLQA